MKNITMSVRAMYYYCTSFYHVPTSITLYSWSSIVHWLIVGIPYVHQVRFKLDSESKNPTGEIFCLFFLHCFFSSSAPPDVLLEFCLFLLHFLCKSQHTLPSISQLATFNFATLIHSFICSSSGSLLSPIFFLCFYFFPFFQWSLFFIIWCNKH